jgi:hypothetical protein
MFFGALAVAVAHCNGKVRKGQGLDDLLNLGVEVTVERKEGTVATADAWTLENGLT